MNLQTLSCCLYLAYLWAENTQKLMLVFPPHYLHTCFFSLHAEGRVNKKTLQKKRATSQTVLQPITAGRPDRSGYRSFISNEACVLNQRQPVTPETKSQESWEAIWSFFDPPSSPTPPTNAPYPKVGQRRNAVQRFCTNKQMGKKHLQEQIAVESGWE